MAPKSKKKRDKREVVPLKKRGLFGEEGENELEKQKDTKGVPSDSYAVPDTSLRRYGVGGGTGDYFLSGHSRRF